MRSWVYPSKLAFKFNKKASWLSWTIFFRGFSFGGPFLRCSPFWQGLLRIEVDVKRLFEMSERDERSHWRGSPFTSSSPRHMEIICFGLDELIVLLRVGSWVLQTIMLLSRKPPKPPTTRWLIIRGTQSLSDTLRHTRIFQWFWIDIHGQSFEHMVSTLKNKWGLFFLAKFLNQDITLRKYNIPSNCCFYPLIRKSNNIISKYVVIKAVTGPLNKHPL